MNFYPTYPSPIQEGVWPKTEAGRGHRRPLWIVLPFGLWEDCQRLALNMNKKPRLENKFSDISNQLAQLGCSKKQLQPQGILLCIAISRFHLSLEVPVGRRAMERLSSKKEKEDSRGKQSHLKTEGATLNGGGTSVRKCAAIVLSACTHV